MGQLSKLNEALERLMATRSPAVSRAELAARMGVARSNVTALLAPRRSLNVKTLSSVLDALGCTLHDLADALDAVNRRGRYSAGEVAASEIAEALSPNLSPKELERIGSLFLQMSLQKDRIRELEAELRAARG